MDQQPEASDILERIKELQEYNSALRKRINELTDRVNKIKLNKGKKLFQF